MRPRHAATLVAWREGARGIEVLMGRRAARHRFVPHHYVFPGGRLDAADFSSPVLVPLKGEVEEKLTRTCTPRLARGLAVAAVRETWEETGLVLGELASGKLAPRLDPLHYILRAITPSSSPIRFHARFFAVEARHLAGELRGNGELLDLAWRPVADCLKLPIVDVTEHLLKSIAEPGFLSGERPRLFSFRNGRVLLREP